MRGPCALAKRFTLLGAAMLLLVACGQRGGGPAPSGVALECGPFTYIADGGCVAFTPFSDAAVHFAEIPGDDAGPGDADPTDAVEPADAGEPADAADGGNSTVLRVRNPFQA